MKGYLVEKFHFSTENVTTAGYGKRMLKNKTDSSAAENRRVQVTNLATANEAKR